MKKFLIGVLCGVLLAGMAGLILLFAAVKLGERAPDIPSAAALVINLEGEIPERAGLELPFPFGSAERTVTVSDLWSALHNAAADSRIKAVIISPHAITAGWAKLDEMRSDLVEFRKSGKPVIAFLVNPGGREYYLASAAEKIYLAPSDMLDLKGLRAEVTYIRKTLDKLGIRMEVEHIGKYKDAGDMFTRTDASPETVTVLNDLLDGIYGQLLEGIAAGRKRTSADIRAVIDQGPFTARQARAAGLVDGLLYEDESFAELKKKAGDKLRKINVADYSRVPASSIGLKAKRTIALLVGEGTILRGGASSFADDQALTATGFIKTIRQVRDDNSLKGVILRINSPGGDAIASDDILHEVKLLAKRKPLVISMSDLAASGGYYIASSGDTIISYPNTLTGSIGVIFARPNLRGLYDKIGVTKQLFTRGRFATIDSEYQPLTEAERNKLRESMEEVYANFVGFVAASRNKTAGQIEPLAQGRVWLGSQARANGLVDEVGGLDRAVEVLKKKAGIPASERVRLAVYPARQSLIDRLLAGSMQSSVDPRVEALWKKFDLSLWTEGGLMKVMPYQLEFK
ncbi:MAG: signal peptide peptidase SppA [Bryobacterales bacterium]|nr:signal peptide peptidase SppA [Bryobacterales bacterium]